ncbi:MAG: elongation factor P [Elusimicrobia bacterium RIFCSPLOWO2_12_FULL_59_9]|nr:elongation factor P [Elusimicrobiota bacterium]OGS02461.1 MAG: elongation factor P [Elusimicrobia bacterium RIFCSPLOWO2_12_FULL_59_9]
MIRAGEFHNGAIFDDAGNILEIIWFQHHKPGKGGAMVRTKIKNLLTGAITERSFSPSDKFRTVEVLKRKKTFLYAEGESLQFMDMESYEQMAIDKKKLGLACEFLCENMEVQGIYIDGNLITVELPKKVTLAVASTVPGVKGDSVSNMTKPATLETGVEIKVPLFIEEGEKVVVSTETGEYIERA